MRKELMIALRATLVTLVLTGILYPLATTGAAELLFSDKANGSLARNDSGQVIGSELIGQAFASPAYLQGRPSAAGNGYDATASSGSNLGTTAKKLRDRAAADVARLQKENPDAPLPIPDGLVTASASGLDPEMSPDAAFWQAPRIARARNIAEDRVRAVIENRVEGRDLGFLGEPRVNVLDVNLALDQQFGRPIPLPGAAAMAGTR
ncbi:MAG TPA: potassium-transporting ATPase subunit KdpC [Polyangia bacterium]|nr:potassium-transporting ATPase subunit KdpC [Polyangia bacterium]